MPKVIGYTYMACCHCPACTVEDARQGQILVNNYHPHAVQLDSIPALNLDEHGVHVNNIDREGNRIQPMFDTDEVEHQQSCDNCCAVIREDLDVKLLKWKQSEQKRREDAALRSQMKHPFNGRFV